MDNYESENREPCYNPQLLRAGGLAALGGLLIYALIAWIVLIIYHCK